MKRVRNGAPPEFGAVELTHSVKSDEADDIMRGLYTHISDGARRSERIIVCNMKCAYAPEADLIELSQVYRQVGQLRAALKAADGARRVLRFFNNDGTTASSSTGINLLDETRQVRKNA